MSALKSMAVRLGLSTAAVLIVVAVALSGRSVVSPGRWLQGHRLALYRVLFGSCLTLLLWASSRWIAAGIFRRLAIGACCGYIAGLFAFAITYKAAGYRFVSGHGIRALWTALGVDFVFLQMLPPAFALGVVAALLYGSSMQWFRRAHR